SPGERNRLPLLLASARQHLRQRRHVDLRSAMEGGREAAALVLLPGEPNGSEIAPLAAAAEECASGEEAERVMGVESGQLKNAHAAGSSPWPAGCRCSRAETRRSAGTRGASRYATPHQP